MKIARRDFFIAIGFMVFSIILGFFNISRYGVMNDANIKYASGFRNYYFITSGDKAYLDPQNTPELAEALGLLHDHTFLNFASFDPVDYSPLVDALSAFTCKILHQELKLLNYFDAHNSIIIILFAIMVGLIYLFASTLYGSFAGIFSAIFFGLFPRLIAHAHNNFNDIPLMFFYFSTIAVFYLAVTKGNSVLLFVSFALFGLAVASKIYAVFLVFVLLPWFFTHKYLNKQHCSKSAKWIWIFSPLIVYLSWLVMFPYFWTAETFEDFFSRQINSHIFTMITNQKVITTELGWNLSVFFQAFATTPPICLFFFIPGFLYSLRQLVLEKDSKFLLLFLWLFIPIAKSSLPGVVNYEMIRHFMEYVPALVIFSALGIVWTFQFIISLPRVFYYRKLIALGGFVLILGSLILPIYKLHPYEIMYFNSLVGGLSGGKKHFMYAFDYWQTSLRPSMVWLNENAKKNSDVLLVGYDEYKILGPVLLRKDLKKVSPKKTTLPVVINLSNNKTINGILNKYDFTGYVLMLNKGIEDNFFMNYLRMNKLLKPVYILETDDEELAKIYYIDQSFGIIKQPDADYFVLYNKGGSIDRIVPVEKVLVPRHY